MSSTKIRLMTDNRNPLAAILAEQANTAAAASPGKSSGASSARGQPATSVRICAVCRARSRGLVSSRSGTLQKSLSPAAALRARRSRGRQRPCRIVAPAMAIALECNRMSDDQQFHRFRAPGRQARRSACARILEFRPQLLPFLPHFSIALCVVLASLRISAAVVLRQPAHQEQRLAAGIRWAARRREPSGGGSPRRHPAAPELLLPAAQRAQHLIGRFAVRWQPPPPARSATSSLGREPRETPPSEESDARRSALLAQLAVTSAGSIAALHAAPIACRCGGAGRGQQRLQFLQALLHPDRIENAQHLGARPAAFRPQVLSQGFDGCPDPISAIRG